MAPARALEAGAALEEVPGTQTTCLGPQGRSCSSDQVGRRRFRSRGRGDDTDENTKKLDKAKSKAREGALRQAATQTFGRSTAENSARLP